MKRKILLLLIIGLSIGHCFCQTGYYVGLHTGIGSNRYFTDDMFKEVVVYVPETNFSVGVIVGYNLKSNILLETGLKYFNDGFSKNFSWNVMDPNDPAIPESIFLKSSYIQLPILAGYIFNIASRIRLIPIIGANLQHLVSSTEESQFMDGSTHESDFFTDIKPFIVVGKFGVRAEFEASQAIAFGIEPYFGKSLTNIDEPEMNSSHIIYGISCTLKIKNNAL